MSSDDDNNINNRNNNNNNNNDINNNDNNNNNNDTNYMKNNENNNENYNENENDNENNSLFYLPNSSSLITSSFFSTKSQHGKLIFPTFYNEINYFKNLHKKNTLPQIEISVFCAKEKLGSVFFSVKSVKAAMKNSANGEITVMLKKKIISCLRGFLYIYFFYFIIFHLTFFDFVPFSFHLNFNFHSDSNFLFYFPSACRPAIRWILTKRKNKYNRYRT